MSLSLLLLLMEGVGVDDDVLLDMHRGAKSERRFLCCLDDEEEDGEKNSRVLLTAPRVEEGTRRAIVWAMTTVTVYSRCQKFSFQLDAC